MRLGRRFLLVPVLAGLALVTTAQPCGACSCAGPAPSDPQALEGADVVFVGTAVAAGDVPRSKIDIDPWTFYVESVQKGPRATHYSLRTGRALQLGRRGYVVAQSSCAIGFQLGHRYQVFARRTKGGGLETGICSNTRELVAAGQKPDAKSAHLQEPFWPGANGVGGVTTSTVAALAALTVAAFLKRRTTLKRSL